MSSKPSQSQYHSALPAQPREKLDEPPRLYQKHTFGATQVKTFPFLTLKMNELRSFSVYEDRQAREIMSSVPSCEDVANILAFSIQHYSKL
jgi:hypothetical protein